jgi:hypothetical protein
MPGKMARSKSRPSVQVTRGAGCAQHLASVLQEGRGNANIDAGLGFIWRISDIKRSNPRPIDVSAVSLSRHQAADHGGNLHDGWRDACKLILSRAPVEAITRQLTLATSVPNGGAHGNT